MEGPKLKNLKRCYIPIYRDWPFGCGPKSDQSQPSDQTEEGEMEEGQNGNFAPIEGHNGNYPYPPPKKRGCMFAIRTWPSGCGPDAKIEIKGAERESDAIIEIKGVERESDSIIEIKSVERESDVEGIKEFLLDNECEIEDVERESNVEGVKGFILDNESEIKDVERESNVKGKGLCLDNEFEIKDVVRESDVKGKRLCLENKLDIKDVERESKLKGTNECAGFRDGGREKLKEREKKREKMKGIINNSNVQKEQRKGEIKHVKIKIFCGDRREKSESSEQSSNFSKSPAEVATDKREKDNNFSKSPAEVAKEKREKDSNFSKSAAEVAKEKREKDNMPDNFSKGPAEVAKERREKDNMPNNFSKSPPEVAKEKREKDNRAEVAEEKREKDYVPNFVSKLRVVPKKRVVFYNNNNNNRFNGLDRDANQPAELEAIATQAIIIHSQNSPKKISPKKTISRTSTSFGTNAGTSTSKPTQSGTSAKKKMARKRKYNTIDKNFSFAPLKRTKKPTDPRAKVKRCLFLFQIICRKLIHEEETGNKPKGISRNRIDLRASGIMKQANEVLNKNNPIIGKVPGVEVGDEYRYRAELHILGLHRPPQAGIDFCDKNGVNVAISIVASGGYSDLREFSDLLIYTGCGGKPDKKSGRLLPEDQKLERGNLAMKNSMDLKSPIRVIHGVNIGDGSKVIMSFAYDGLYLVERFWREMQSYDVNNEKYHAQVFKFQLRRMPGQPELTWNKASRVKRSKGVREGLCVKDISGGKEKNNPICAINTIDDEKPPVFKYITNNIYPFGYKRTHKKCCSCKGQCSGNKNCECVLKNGGEIPFNFNGAIIQEKTLIYECGPSCRCSKNCPNRVSQHGIQIPLEIFKTETRGWGVRSLNSIPSGTFICEYIGEIITENEANQKEDDSYLFQIGHNYDDVAIWRDLPSCVPGLDSGPVLSEGEMEGFTIDAAETGNVARFINHSCSPNLYPQYVLYDNDDVKMPHVMLFAMENIPPLQELTYHYNYRIGEVVDCDGNEKSLDCLCEAADCRGRLY